MWYLVLKDLETGKEQFVEHYDEFDDVLELTDDAQFRQEYLSIDALLEDVSSILNEPEISDGTKYDVKKYQLIIGHTEF